MVSHLLGPFVTLVSYISIYTSEQSISFYRHHRFAMAKIVLHQSSPFAFLDVSYSDVHGQGELAIMVHLGARQLLRL